jgi:hypothetical protein
MVLQYPNGDTPDFFFAELPPNVIEYVLVLGY